MLQQSSSKLRISYIHENMLANKTILQMKYARIIKRFAEKGHLTYEDAMDKFYNSDTYTLISEGVADMHCMSDEYLADELLIEFGMLKVQ